MNEQMVYIARALDKSWASVANDEEHARRLIAAREPDIVKQGQYQILVEPMSKLMANAIPGIQRGLVQKLVKWDGDPPIPPDAADNPTKYPQVAEVIEGGDGIPTRTLYRRP
jgi:hypothetical protein